MLGVAALNDDSAARIPYFEFRQHSLEFETYSRCLNEDVEISVEISRNSAEIPTFSFHQ